MSKKRIYLDNNATTPIDKSVKEIYIKELDNYANPSSLHQDGRNVGRQIELAREKLANLINANKEEIIFTSGGTESNNMVFNILNTNDFLNKTSYKKYSNRKKIIITSIEHPCVIESSKNLKKLGFKLEFLPVDKTGIVKIDKYKELLFGKNGQGFKNPNDETLLVSIMMANNEIGTVQNIKELSELAHKAGALFHTDAVQAIGKIPVDVKELNVDYLTISGHKIYAPKGVGALYIKENSPKESLIKGGHQEKGLRAGTYNAPAIVAFGEAAHLAKTSLEEYKNHTLFLKDKLKNGLIKNVPNIFVNGNEKYSLPNTLNVSFPGAEGEAILLMFDFLGIAVSTGSACASGNLDASHVLQAIGAGPELAHGSIRFSIGKYNTEEEIEYVINEVPKVIEKLRSYSTLTLE